MAKKRKMTLEDFLGDNWERRDWEPEARQSIQPSSKPRNKEDIDPRGVIPSDTFMELEHPGEVLNFHRMGRMRMYQPDMIDADSNAAFRNEENDYWDNSVNELARVLAARKMRP